MTEKKMWNTTIAILVVFALVIGACLGVYFFMKSPAKFTSLDGKISITLSRSFNQDEGDNFKIANEKVVFCATSTDFSVYDDAGLESNILTSEEVANTLATEKGATTIRDEENGIVYFEYVNEDNGNAYYNFVAVKRGTEEFWQCSFYCLEKNKEGLKQSFIDWSKSIEIIKD